jgi:hypothetical protein
MTAKRFDPPLWMIGLFVWGCVSTLLALAHFFMYDVVRDPLADFGAFYLDGRAWRAGTALYQVPNLNTPLLTVLLFGPLSALPFSTAQVIWTVAGAVALVASVRVVARELHTTLEQTAGILVTLLVLHGTSVAWSGQTGWFMLWLVTLAWASYRHDAQVRAGCWLGCAIAVKPTLAITALLLPWRVCAVAGGVSLALSLLGVAVTGWAPWEAWYRVGNAANWLGGFSNGSILGLWARLQSGSFSGITLADVSPWGWVCTGLIAGLIAWQSMTERRPDRRMLVALLGFLLLSPLSWSHYPLVALGPAAAVWTWNRWTVAAVVLASLPVWFAVRAQIVTTDSAVWLLLALGSFQSAALVCAWIGWTRRPLANP